MKNKAFTLIELLVVIAIIGLLASIVLVNLTGQRQKARIARGLQFSQSVHHALGAYAVGVWRLDEGSGTTAYDSSGYGNDGNISGASYTTNTPSSQGHALIFDGVDDYVEIQYDSSLQFTDKCSWVAWILPEKFDSDGGMGRRIYYQINDPSLYVSETNLFVLILRIGSTRYFHASPANSLIPSQWNFITVTYDGSYVRHYVNGLLVGTPQARSGNLDLNTNNIRMGKAGTADGRFKGVIDEVRIYEQALKTSQIESLYYAGLDNLLEKGLISHQEYQEKLTIK